VTGGLEILTAALIGDPLVRGAGIVLGALVILAAVATLLRHGAYSHLPPAVAFLVGIALVVLTFGASPGSGRVARSRGGARIPV
jgi:hypothetical protein